METIGKQEKRCKTDDDVQIDRELVSITKENRLIPPCRRFRNTHNRAFQLESLSYLHQKDALFPKNSEGLESAATRHCGPGHT
jgi:hypothetical protein